MCVVACRPLKPTTCRRCCPGWCGVEVVSGVGGEWGWVSHGDTAGSGVMAHVFNLYTQGQSAQRTLVEKQLNGLQHFLEMENVMKQLLRKNEKTAAYVLYIYRYI